MLGHSSLLAMLIVQVCLIILISLCTSPSGLGESAAQNDHLPRVHSSLDISLHPPPKVFEHSGPALQSPGSGSGMGQDAL